MLARELLDILICPNCRGDIEYREAEQVIVCLGECGYEYPVIDDIPHMLVDGARRPSGGKQAREPVAPEDEGKPAQKE